MQRLSVTQPSRAGFSLVELLTVLAIIAILAAIIIPSVGGIRENARKTAAASKLREISRAYNLYANASGRPRTLVADSVHNWALELAQEANFNDAEVYFLLEDPEVEAYTGALPRVVGTPPASGAGAWTIDGDFSGMPLSFAVVSRLASRAPTSTTPLAWTRGLQTSGTWDANTGVYGSEGGHIVYLDSHVDFYRDLSEDGGRLVDYDSKTGTANIEDALSPAAVVLEYSAGQ